MSRKRSCSWTLRQLSLPRRWRRRIGTTTSNVNGHCQGRIQPRRSWMQHYASSTLSTPLDWILCRRLPHPYQQALRRQAPLLRQHLQTVQNLRIQEQYLPEVSSTEHHSHNCLDGNQTNDHYLSLLQAERT